MKLYGYELYKLAKKRIFWASVAVVLALAFFVFQLRQADYTYLSDNRGLYEKLVEFYSDMPQEQARAELEKKQAEYEIRLYASERASNENAALLLSVMEEEYPEIYEQVMEQKETLSHRELNSYWQIYSKLLAEAAYITGFPAYLDEIQANADKMSSVSLFAEEENFTYQNIQKTAEDYQKLNGLHLSFGMDRGLLAVTDFTEGDALLIVLAFLLCLFLFSEEESSGMLRLLRGEKKGRLPLAAAKLTALLTVVLVLGAIYVTVIYGWAESLYGFGDVTRPIQSMEAFAGAGSVISVKQYLCFSALSKIGTLMGTATFFAAVFILLRNSPVLTAVGCVLPLGLLWMFYEKMPDNALLNHVKYVNPFCFMNGLTLYGSYINLNIFSTPVSLRTLFLVVCPLLAIVCLVISAVAFVYYRPGSGQVFLHAVWEKVSLLWRKRDKASGLFPEEGVKILLQGKVLLILAAAVLLGIIGLRQSNGGFDVDDLVYRKYIRQVEGPLTEESQKLLEEKQKDFENLPQAEAEYDRLYEQGRITKQEMQAGKQYLQTTLGLQQAGFEKVLEDAAYAEENGTWMTDQLTANAWLCDNSRELKDGLLLLAGAILCLTPIYTMDESRKMRPILRNTKKGRESLTFVKICWSLLILLILYLCVYVPEFVQLTETYGMPLWKASLQSVKLFCRSGLQMNILTFYVMTHVIRLILLAAACLMILFIAVKVKKSLPAMAAAAILLLAPLVLQLQGIEMRYFCFNNVFLLPDSLTNGKNLMADIANGTILLLIGCICCAGLFLDSRTHRRRMKI